MPTARWMFIATGEPIPVRTGVDTMDTDVDTEFDAADTEAGGVPAGSSRPARWASTDSVPAGSIARINWDSPTNGAVTTEGGESPDCPAKGSE